MNIAIRKPAAAPMTLEQFLTWEERQELRYEFDGIRPIAMVGGTIAHSTIQANLLIALGNRLRGAPCRPHGSHMKIKVAGRIRYSDAFVVCTKLPPRAKVVTDPVVVFEVTSDSSFTTDLIHKNADYKATPSIQRYVIIEQASVAAWVFFRKGEDWVSDSAIGGDAMLPMPEIGIEVPLAEIYAGLDFGTGDGAQADEA
jgi:Uma2 family endonuclease